LYVFRLFVSFFYTSFFRVNSLKKNELRNLNALFLRKLRSKRALNRLACPEIPRDHVLMLSALLATATTRPFARASCKSEVLLNTSFRG